MQLAVRAPPEGEHVRLDQRRHGAEYGAAEVSQAAVETNTDFSIQLWLEDEKKVSPQ